MRLHSYKRLQQLIRRHEEQLCQALQGPPIRSQEKYDAKFVFAYYIEMENNRHHVRKSFAIENWSTTIQYACRCALYRGGL